MKALRDIILYTLAGYGALVVLMVVPSDWSLIWFLFAIEAGWRVIPLAVICGVLVRELWRHWRASV